MDGRWTPRPPFGPSKIGRSPPAVPASARGMSNGDVAGRSLHAPTCPGLKTPHQQNARRSKGPPSQTTRPRSANRAGHRARAAIPARCTATPLISKESGTVSAPSVPESGSSRRTRSRSTGPGIPRGNTAISTARRFRSATKTRRRSFAVIADRNRSSGQPRSGCPRGGESGRISPGRVNHHQLPRPSC
jgi:hypothetical protein